MDPERDTQPPVISPSTPSPMRNVNSAVARPRFSALAIISLIAGFISPIFIIACFLSLITSTVAIVTGHIALYKIKRSSSQLDGRAVAIVGTVLGYISMALTIAFIAFIFTRPPSRLGSSTFATGQSVSQSRLDEAELSIISGSRGNVARGNTEQARELAEVFAQTLKRADEAVFTSNRQPKVQLSGGEYVTHCELHENSCAFIVHVPSYRNFTNDAEEALNTIAWIAASEAVKDHLQNGDALAIGLRGTMIYGDVLIGTYTGDDNKRDFSIRSAKDLLPFFELDGKQQMNIGRSPSGSSPFEFPSQATATPSEASPFDPPTATPTEPELADSKHPDSETIQPAFTEPEAPSNPKNLHLGEQPMELATVESSTASPTPEVETPKVSSTPKPKREEKTFENKIPVSLLKSIDAQGWNIQSMIFDQQGDRLITGGLDQTISVFDVRSGEMLFRSKRQEELGQVVSLALAKDGKTVFAGGSNGRVASFAITDGGQVEFAKALYKHNRDAQCLIVSPAFPFVLSGGEDGTVTWQPYDDRSNTLKLVQELKRKVLAAHLFRDRSEGIATDGQSLIRFSIKDSKVLSQLALGKSYPQAAAISPDGSRCAVSYGSELKVFDTSTGKQIQSEFASKEMNWAVMYHPTKPWLVTGNNGKAMIWDAQSSTCLAVLDAGSIQYVSNLAITADGKKLALIPSSAGQSIQVFDLTQ